MGGDNDFLSVLDAAQQEASSNTGQDYEVTDSTGETINLAGDEDSIITK